MLLEDGLSFLLGSLWIKLFLILIKLGVRYLNEGIVFDVNVSLERWDFLWSYDFFKIDDF